MVPGEWWTKTGHDHEEIAEDPEVRYHNGVPERLARQAQPRERDQQGAWLSLPCTGRHPCVHGMRTTGLRRQRVPVATATISCM